MVAKSREQKLVEKADALKAQGVVTLASDGEGGGVASPPLGAAPEQAAARVLVTSGGRVPLGRIYDMECPLYPGLVVHYAVSAPQEKWRAEVEGDTPLQRLCRKLAASAPAFTGWDFLHPATYEPIPVPDPTDLSTYEVLILDTAPLHDLGMWIIDNYALAVERSLGNSQRASSAPSSKGTPRARRSASGRTAKLT